MSAIIPWKEKLVNVMSFLSYRDDKQNLSINPASYLNNLDSTKIISSDLVNQFLNLKTFEANHSASVGFSAKSWTFTPEVGFNYTRNKLITDLNGEKTGAQVNFGDEYENNIKFQNITPYAQLMMNYKKNSFEANLNLPANFNNITATDSGNLDKKLNKITYEPRLFARYDITSFWKISTFTGLSNSFGTVNDIYSGKILFSARNISSKDTDIQLSKSRYIGSRLEYRNPLNNIFFNINYNINDRSSNISYLNQLFVKTQQVVTTGYNLENTAQSNSLRTELGKYFPKFKTNASIGYSNTFSKSQQLETQFVNSNDDVINILPPTKADFQDIKTTNEGVTFKFNNNYFSWLSVDYNGSLSFINSESFGTRNTSNKSKNYNHVLSAYIYPIKNHTIGFTWDEMQFNNATISRKNSFYDISYQYSLVEEKMDIELKLLNIANTNLYQDIIFDATTGLSTYRNINIRPRQVMLTLKFNFK